MQQPVAQLQRTRRRQCGGLIALLLTLSLATPASAAESDAGDKEAAVRAAFLYRLAFFVTWDASAFPAADSPIRFCIASDAPSRVADLLRGQAGNRRVNERGIAVEQRASEAALDDCHIVYREGSKRAASTAANTQLVVVDSLDALAGGGTLALVPERAASGELRLGFVSRRDRLPNGGVSLSAKLLQLVRFDDGKGGS